MFTCAGTPLALPYQEFTKGMNPLAPGKEGQRGMSGTRRLGEVHPMKRNDIQKRGKRMEEMTGMWKIPMKEGKTAHGNTGYNFSRSKTKLTR